MLDGLFTPKWCLQFLFNGNPIYELRDSSPYRLVGFVTSYFANDHLAEGWTVVLKNNVTDKAELLEPTYFNSKGKGFTVVLANRIEILITEKSKSTTKGKPLFMELQGKKKIPIPSAEEQQKELIKNQNPYLKQRRTFYTVMNNQIFVK